MVLCCQTPSVGTDNVSALCGVNLHCKDKHFDYLVCPLKENILATNLDVLLLCGSIEAMCINKIVLPVDVCVKELEDKI